ncbi:MAG: hypothetical protein J6S04_05165 [Clostridia bacterium]|nr:hypothetical protein [Clostridia bacterium]
MSKKSLLYIGAGVLFILAAVLFYVERILLVGADVMHNGFTLSFKSLRIDWIKEMAKDSMTNLDWMNIAFLALVGVVMLVKALMPDLVPEIALVGVLGLIAMVWVGKLVVYMMDMGRMGGLSMNSMIVIGQDWLMLAAFAGMAAIIFLKDSLGQFYFVPAMLAITSLVISILMHVTGMFGYARYTFGSLLLLLIMDVVTPMALLATGMANKEE